MKFSGPCKLIKIYVNENSKFQGHNLYHAIVFKMKEIGMAGVTVSRGIEGYGQGGRLHTTRILDLTLDLPVVIEIVDIPERVEKAIPILKEMIQEGLMTISDVDVINYGSSESEF